MNSVKKLLLVTLISLSIFSPTFAESNELNGIKLCDRTYSFLRENKLKPIASSFINSGENNLPYNIELSFEKDDVDTNLLIITFKMQEAYNNKELILMLADYLKSQEFSSSILLVYGADKNIQQHFTENGSTYYAQNINSNINNIVLNINLSADKNNVITGSLGHTSPSWMIQDLINSYYSENLIDELNHLYVSQISKYNFVQIPILSSFLNNDIPAITANFNLEKTNIETIFRVINSFTQNYIEHKNNSLDYHSSMIRIRKTNIWFSEYITVILIIISFFICCAIIFIISYVNAGLKNSLWQDLKRNWYLLPVTFILTIAGFYIGKVFYNLFTPNLENAKTTFGIIVVQIITAALLNSVFYLMEMFFHKKNYGERSIDYLILITAFINQFVFCFIDISLFPIFFIVYIITLLCLIMHRNWLHIFMWFVMLLPFLPYVLLVYRTTDSFSLLQFIIFSKKEPLYFAFILLPDFLMFLRILTAIKNKFDKKLTFTIIISISYVVIITTTILINSLGFKIHTNSRSTTIYPSDNNDLMSLSYADRNIFGEKVRTIYIDSKEDIEILEIRVIGENELPVLYSEYDYRTITKTSAIFTLPANPPKNLRISFGTNDSPCKILIEAIYKTDKPNEYISNRKTIEIKE